ncbi:MAG: hypothetical protein ACWA5T_02960 [Parvularcula sp.]
MKNVALIALMLASIGGCSSMAEAQTEFVVCPEESGAFVQDLLGERIPKNRDGVIALLQAQDIPFEYPQTQSQSPFCDKSLVSSSVIQAFFPLSEDEKSKPVLKFLFSEEGTLIGIEELTQHLAP